jgi:antitoxin (DNA-binding transcriptional repressor) of toxin-antitoxin stability system
MAMVAAAGLMLAAERAAAWPNITAASGSNARLDFWISINPDCTSRGRPVVRVTAAPQNGRALVVPARDFIPQNAKLSHCSNRRTAGTHVRYVSRKGFVGTDRVSVEVFFPTGRHLAVTYTIDVR